MASWLGQGDPKAFLERDERPRFIGCEQHVRQPSPRDGKAALGDHKETRPQSQEEASRLRGEEGTCLRDCQQ